MSDLEFLRRGLVAGGGVAAPARLGDPTLAAEPPAVSYPGGVALRFARGLRHCPDKSAREADTLEAVLAVRAGASVSGPAHPPR